ncbi:hypothetical protein ES319_D10G245900v1 [Gossypium barbadense]|uniref:Dirigent protein n=2 Tax=Gossypium TaxID=3633 RepID=A0A5J5PVX0_GOSBA|nr:hypothetical protein ES319_D10G245900v1 [Gossypium barbadense]TYG51547.1 hypothetical protein ES288_D10G266100v1 [Gossypium darwinii]
MAKAPMLTSKTFKAIIYLLLVAITFTCVNSARVLDEVEPQPQVVDDKPSGQVVPAATPSGPEDDPPVPTVAAPASEDEAPVATPAAPEAPADDDDAPVDTPAAPVAGGAATGPGAAAATGANPGSHEPALSFFMHDILGGTHPSARVVTGVIANQEINGIPFSKTNNNIFPVEGAAPLLTGNNINNLKNINNLINPNNVPFLTGLTGAQTSAVVQNSHNSDSVINSDSNPFVTAGQLPPGSLQRLMFGTITVIDDQLTEAHELGSAILGKAQGFYLASSVDGSSQTIALTVLLHGGEHGHEIEDTISFFGVHRTVSPESQIAVIGGTGKYENTRGYATVETLLNQENQHITDGVDTILHFNVYLTE